MNEMRKRSSLSRLLLLALVCFAFEFRNKFIMANVLAGETVDCHFAVVAVYRVKWKMRFVPFNWSCLMMLSRADGGV